MPPTETSTIRGCCVLLAAAALLLGVRNGAAQQRDTIQIDTPYEWITRSLRVGAVGGYVDTNLGALQLGPHSTPVVGLRGRARISSPISLEATALYGESDRFVIDPRLPSGPAPVDTASSRWILAEAAMQFAVTGNRTWHDLQPYAVIGAGFLVGVDEERSPVFSAPELSAFRYDLEVMPSVQAGVGVEWLLGDRWGVGFEFRDHLWRISTPGGQGQGFFSEEVLQRIEDLDLEAPQETDWTHNMEFGVTIWRYF